jgi:hypothetical protein
MTSPLLLLPIPRKCNFQEGFYHLREIKLVLLNSVPQNLRFIAGRFRRVIKELGFTWDVVASPSVPTSEIGLVLRILPELIREPQGYWLTITPECIDILAHDEAGIYYGICTLNQIIQQTGEAVPCLEIRDWPDYPSRGVMLDVSRDKVPTMDTLYDLVDLLSTWKINQLQLYVEHTFAYRNHPVVWELASPFTGEDILELDEFCRQRYIELVPNQNSFGHMQRWLKHPQYTHLSEVSDSFKTPWGHESGPFSLCPEDPESIALIDSLYDELLPHFSSRMINVGCDETFDLGQGRSKQACDERGIGRVYLDYLLKIYQSLLRRGYRMQFWGDIILQYPELIKELPVDMIALAWGYEANHPFDEQGAKFAASGIPFYVCPGTSSWCSLAGRTDNTLDNLLNAAENGLKHGACGYLNTDWGDLGHWQVLPVSYLGFAAGAGYSWCLDANRNLDVRQVLSQYALQDTKGIMGKLAYDLGNIYRVIGIEPPNNSTLFQILQNPLIKIQGYSSLSPETFIHTLEEVDQTMIPLLKAQMIRADSQLIQDEFTQTAHLIRHACKRALLALEGDPTKAHLLRQELSRDLRDIIVEYKCIWLARNRPGGLVDSVARLEAMNTDYIN